MLTDRQESKKGWPENDKFLGDEWRYHPHILMDIDCFRAKSVKGRDLCDASVKFLTSVCGERMPHSEMEVK